MAWCSPVGPPGSTGLPRPWPIALRPTCSRSTHSVVVTVDPQLLSLDERAELGPASGSRDRSRAQAGGRPMIRINLLAGSTVPPPRRASIDLGQRVTLACSVIVVATAVVIGWRFWSLRQELNQFQQQLTVAD